MIITLENHDRFLNFCTVVSRKNCFTHTWQKCPPHLNNVLTLPSENENITFHSFIMHSLIITRCIKHGVKHKVHQVSYRENKLKYVQNVRHWHKHNHASAFAIGQLCHQSATAPSRVTHAVDAVTAHRCHELWSHTHVATIAPDMWLGLLRSPVF